MRRPASALSEALESYEDALNWMTGVSETSLSGTALGSRILDGNISVWTISLFS